MRVATSDVICLFLLNTKTSAQRFGAPIETPVIITSWAVQHGINFDFITVRSEIADILVGLNSESGRIFE